jgi:argininosuccinate lyase
LSDGPLWGGRFDSAPAADLLRLTSSLSVDIELLPYDLAATKAHARALAAASLIESTDIATIDAACRDILTDHRAGRLEFSDDDEDVHSVVERELTARLGELGKRIHAGRSRNDLVVTDLRLWCRDAAERLKNNTCDLIEIMTEIATGHQSTLLPGYTHLQRAQPVTLAFHLLAHAFALARDGYRFAAARTAADTSALGAGAIAGTTLPLDATIPAGYLGFSNVFDNAMDAVSDRDFACDLVYACALCAVHLSRLAEEIVLWTSSEFAYARLADDWSTGSSMMPQKRNPDVAELTRGRAATTIGDLTSLLALLKGQPLAYNRDLQEDKVVVFGAVEKVERCLEGMRRLVSSLDFETERMAAAATQASSGATDVAERLVKRGVPFRDAHHASGRLVAALEEEPEGMSEDGLRAIHPLLDPTDLRHDPASSVAARESHGGTASPRTTEQIGRISEVLTELRRSP